MAKGKKPANGTIDWRTWSRFRADDRGIKVRNFFRTHRIGWDEVRLLTDGWVRGRSDSRWWALRIVLHDGRVITAAETSSWKTAADPAVLSAIGQAAGRHAVPAELTGMPPESSPGVVTIADGGRWSWSRLRFDDDGIVVRNVSRTYQIGWGEVRWFTDGSEQGCWVLRIELDDGSVITADASRSGHPAARPGTLAAIRQAVGRHAVPAVLTGTAPRHGEPGSPGLYVDPGGKLGLRQWTGTEWSPFLQMDPASSGPEGEKGPAAVWSPLPEPEQQRQWDAAASRARQAGIWFAAFLGATAVAAAVMLAVFVYDLGQPTAGLRWTGWGLFWLGCGGFLTWGIWNDRKKSRKVHQAAKRAAELAGAVDGVPDPLHDRGDTPAAQAPVAGQLAAADPAAGTVRIRCLECGADCAESTQICARCGAPPIGLQPSLTGDPEEGGPGLAHLIGLRVEHRAGQHIRLTCLPLCRGP